MFVFALLSGLSIKPAQAMSAHHHKEELHTVTDVIPGRCPGFTKEGLESPYKVSTSEIPVCGLERLAYHHKHIKVNGHNYIFEAVFDRKDLHITGHLFTDLHGRKKNVCTFKEQMKVYSDSLHLNGATCQVEGHTYEFALTGELCKGYASVMSFCMSAVGHVEENIVRSIPLTLEEFKKVNKGKGKHDDNHHGKHDDKHHGKHDDGKHKDGKHDKHHKGAHGDHEKKAEHVVVAKGTLRPHNPKTGDPHVEIYK